MFRKIGCIILALLLMAALCACAANKTEPYSPVGSYAWEYGGFGGTFTITLNADGSYTYYAGSLSSYIGMGTWTVEDNVVTMDENEDFCGYDNTFYFQIGTDTLTFIKEGSSKFMYVTVEDGSVFHRITQEAQPTK